LFAPGRAFLYPGANFSYIFCGKILGENSAEIFPPKNGKRKLEFSAEKVLKNKFPQEIPRKITFR
jgi:hypothetical protein